MPEPKKKPVILEWIESILIAFVLAILIRTYFIQPFKIPSGSMRPTLVEDNRYMFFGSTFVLGDHLFVSKLRYGPLLLPEIHTPDFLKGKVDIHWPDFIAPLTKVRLPGFRKPQRGDVIVFVFPMERGKDFIKRLVGLPGDVLEIRDGHALINGKQASDPLIKNIYYTNGGAFGAEGQPIKIPEGKYFVMGDNTNNSHDSRYWGFVDEHDLIGKAEFIFFPFDRVRFIK